MTRPVLIWALLWALIASAVAAGIVAGFLALAALALAPRVAGDVPVAATAVPAAMFTPITPPRPSPAIGSQPIPGPRGEHAGGTLPDVRVGANTDPHPRPSPESASLSGVASWFASPIGVSAAGPALRTALGSGWRGTRVTVCAAGRCAVTVLADWCACPRRAVDLDAPVFAALAPLSQGLMEVLISW